MKILSIIALISKYSTGLKIIWVLILKFKLKTSFILITNFVPIAYFLLII